MLFPVGEDADLEQSSCAESREQQFEMFERRAGRICVVGCRVRRAKGDSKVLAQAVG